jgi:hypothetical protein
MDWRHRFKTWHVLAAGPHCTVGSTCAARLHAVHPLRCTAVPHLTTWPGAPNTHRAVTLAVQVPPEDTNGGADAPSPGGSNDENSPEDPVATNADSDSADDNLEPRDAVRKYLSKGKAPLGLWDALCELPVEGSNAVVGRMKLFYAALLGGQEGRIAERMAPRDKYILSLKRDDKAQAAQLIALEHYLTQARAALLC